MAEAVVRRRTSRWALAGATLALGGLVAAPGEARAVDAGAEIATPARPPAPARAAKEAAKRDGSAMYDAFRKGDLERFAGYTYVGLLNMLGGKQKMIAFLEKGRSNMAAEGFRFSSAEVGAARELVTAGPELHTLLPLKQVLTAPGGELHVEGHLLGISRDGGRSWTFIDTEKLTPENVRQILPTYNPRLQLPGKSEPKLIRK